MASLLVAALPPGGLPRDVVSVKVVCVIGAATRGSPAAEKSGEEHGGVLPLAALRRARRRVGDGIFPPRLGRSPVALA